MPTATPDLIASSHRAQAGSDWMPPRWLLLALLCGVIGVRGKFADAFALQFADDPDHYAELAIATGLRGTYGFWSGGGVAETAFRPPLYPILLIPCLPQIVPWGINTVGLLHIGLGVITVWAAWRLGLAWKLPPWAALVAAGLVAVDPILLNQSRLIMTETLAACMAALALLALTRAVDSGSLRRYAVAGALAGLAVLCRPTFLTWLGLVLVALPFCIPLDWRAALARIAVLWMAAAAVLAPWTLRNAFVFGAPVMTTTHGGFTFLLGNNPEFYEYLRSGDWGEVWDGQRFTSDWEEQARTRERISDYGLTIDEVRNDALAYAAALENIRNEPHMFGYACLVRVGRLWSVLPHYVPRDPDLYGALRRPEESAAGRGKRYTVAIWYAFELVLALVGAMILRKQLLCSPWLWGTLLVLAFSAVHTLYWTDMRMRAPLTCVIALLAAQAVAVLARRKQTVSSAVAST